MRLASHHFQLCRRRGLAGACWGVCPSTARASSAAAPMVAEAVVSPAGAVVSLTEGDASPAPGSVVCRSSWSIGSVYLRAGTASFVRPALLPACAQLEYELLQRPVRL